mgnify:CR=1 FL=1
MVSWTMVGDVIRISELKLQPRLHEVRHPARTEAIETADAVAQLESYVVGEMPVEHRRHAPEDAAVDATVANEAPAFRLRSGFGRPPCGRSSREPTPGAVAGASP